jgi:hypothetical protein
MLRQMQASMPKFFPAGAAAPAPVPAWVMLPSGLAFAAIPIYFMLRRRPAFH